MTANARSLSAPFLPEWVPDDARAYLVHVEGGVPIRSLARASGCHASTILRQVRKLECRRDDLLVDSALHRLGAEHFLAGREGPAKKENGKMALQTAERRAPVDPSLFEDNARQVLRRLCEKGAVMAVAEGMEKAVVVRDDGVGEGTRTAVVAQDLAEALALKGWIGCDAPGRISRYRITPAGRAAFSDFVARDEVRARGLHEAPAAFDHAQGDADYAGRCGGQPRAGRYSLTESPLIALARRRDKDGQPFLSDALVASGERLREDYELSRIGVAPEAEPDWDAVVRGVVLDIESSGSTQVNVAARARVARALRGLGPGLGDVVLRCCCQLEGLETAERHMGWSARSGKIVLRIALHQLRRHYEAEGSYTVLIG